MSNIPMPNEKLDDRIVVASCYYRELSESDRQYMDANDDWPDTVYLVLLLNPQSPFFTVAHVSPDRRILESETRYNIVEAVHLYEEWGGDI